MDILKKDGRASGVQLKDGTRIEAPIVINVAGPHSYQFNGMGGVLDGMKILLDSNYATLY